MIMLHPATMRWQIDRDGRRKIDRYIDIDEAKVTERER